MNKIEHSIKHQYQPTNTSCSPTALSMLLGYYEKQLTVNEISASVPQVVDEKGENSGTINTQMATWCVSLGFDVVLYTFDCQIIDQSWRDLPKEKITERLEARKDGWEVPSLGALWNTAYCQSYIDFLKAGGVLHIQPAVSSKLIYELLENGPILPCLSFSTLHEKGRTKFNGVNESVSDDVHGRAMNHSVVIYGVDDNRNFLVADPWEKPGLHTVEPERMIAAISTAQLECDNLMFQLSKK